MTSAITDAAVVPSPERGVGALSDPPGTAVVANSAAAEGSLAEGVSDTVVVFVADSAPVIDSVPVADPAPVAGPTGDALADPITVSFDDRFVDFEPAEGPARAWLLAVVLVGLALAVALATLAMVVARRVPSGPSVSVNPAAAGGFQPASPTTPPVPGQS